MSAVLSGAIAASDTNFLQLSVVNLGEAGAGNAVVAELDSRAAHENALAAKVKEPLNLPARVAVTPATVLEVKADATGTVAGNCVVTISYVTNAE